MSALLDLALIFRGKSNWRRGLLHSPLFSALQKLWAEFLFCHCHRVSKTHQVQFWSKGAVFFCFSSSLAGERENPARAFPDNPGVACPRASGTFFWQPGFSVSEKLLGWFENLAMSRINFF